MPGRSVCVWALLAALAMSGCASREPRCDGALQPINTQAAAPGSSAPRHSSHGAHAS
jgi:type IV pilus biogenesis protein CpaD/CtpE